MPNVVLCGRPALIVDVARRWRPVRTSYGLADTLCKPTLPLHAVNEVSARNIYDPRRRAWRGPDPFHSDAIDRFATGLCMLSNRQRNCLLFRLPRGYAVFRREGNCVG